MSRAALLVVSNWFAYDRLFELLIVVFVGVPIVLGVYVLWTIFGRRSQADRLQDLYGPAGKGTRYRDRTRTDRRHHVRKDDVV